ncbi:hypothetical protein AK812_SmicGene6999 [Symbiodinium microadriaticum]|uniref:Uncharacterized protein n=1 Tax=Symbiodinium microadriaticum TaxID=2951 RepID=A0A1Q9EPX2_SYMMI|nr:hypothetical protein AK812_SmicGene6999 [Symbiodinium microadriaticum]
MPAGVEGSDDQQDSPPKVKRRQGEMAAPCLPSTHSRGTWSTTLVTAPQLPESDPSTHSRAPLPPTAATTVPLTVDTVSMADVKYQGPVEIMTMMHYKAKMKYLQPSPKDKRKSDTSAPTTARRSARKRLDAEGPRASLVQAPMEVGVLGLVITRMNWLNEWDDDDDDDDKGRALSHKALENRVTLEDLKS